MGAEGDHYIEHGGDRCDLLVESGPDHPQRASTGRIRDDDENFAAFVVLGWKCFCDERADVVSLQEGAGGSGGGQGGHGSSFRTNRGTVQSTFWGKGGDQELRFWEV